MRDGPPALSSHKPEVPWVIVTIIGLSYVHNPGCVTVEDNKKSNALRTGPDGELLAVHQETHNLLTREKVRISRPN